MKLKGICKTTYLLICIQLAIIVEMVYLYIFVTVGNYRGVYPKYINVLKGKPIVLSCQANKAMWFFNDILLQFTGSTRYLQIINISSLHDGKYVCFGRRNSENPYFLSASAVNVIGKY